MNPQTNFLFLCIFHSAFEIQIALCAMVKLII